MIREELKSHPPGKEKRSKCKCYKKFIIQNVQAIY